MFGRQSQRVARVVLDVHPNECISSSFNCLSSPMASDCAAILGHGMPHMLACQESSAGLQAIHFHTQKILSSRLVTPMS